MNKSVEKIAFIEKFIELIEFNDISIDTAKKSCNELFLDEDYFYIWYYNGLEDIVNSIEEYLDNKMELNSSFTLNDKTFFRIKYLLINRIFIENGKYKFLLKKLYKFYTNPLNIKIGIKNSYRTINKMWYFALDQSTDYNFYTKRAILFTIYNSSIIYYLKNNDENFSKTEELINQFLLKISFIPKIKNKLSKFTDIPFLRQFQNKK